MYGGIYGVPGQGSLAQTQEREIIFGGMDYQVKVIKMDTTYGSTLVDAGNTPTTLVRAGMLLGKITSSGKHVMWDPLTTDGTGFLSGVLPINLNMLGESGSAVDRGYARIVQAPLRASQLLIKGSALVGHAYEFLARQQLYQAGFMLDDDPMGYQSGLVFRSDYATGTTLAPTAAADNGKTFFVSNANAVAVTLPAIKPGLRFRFIRTANEEIVVSSAAGDDIVVGNDTAADSVTFTTAGEQIGTAIEVFSAYIDTSTLRWIMHLPNMPFGTGLTGGFTYAIGT